AGRLHGFADLAAVQETLEKLVERDYVERLPRRPGQKEERFAHLLGERAEPTEDPLGDEDAETERRGPEDRVDRVERELAELRAQVHELREALGEPTEGI
ncbi:MAG TPA: hypothetical protein VFC52_01380, partial [Solirubrobacterales bacterium]|nr:hypothetical protein [Solirubrobacterales bacterium]